MKPGMTTVATFTEPEKAETVKRSLEEGGINAIVEDQSKLQKFWYVSKSLASQKVLVEDSAVRKAVQFLKEADARKHILSGEIRCPQCGSARVDYPQFTRKFMATTFVELFCFLRLVDKTFYCEACHHTWPPGVTLRTKTDALNWPKRDGELVRQEKG